MPVDRQLTDGLYDQFARIGKAVGSPRRLELLEVLGQSERSVEQLAAATGMTVTNASAHLQVLRRARLVDRRREGARAVYRLADETVARFLAGLQELARALLAEVDQAVRDRLSAHDRLEPIGRAELARRLAQRDVVVVDVRPADEFAAGHIADTRSIPLAQLEQRLGELPGDLEIVAYCRGPYCALAPAALEILHRNGFRARRLTDGFPQWRMAGLPVTEGEEPHE